MAMIKMLKESKQQRYRIYTPTVQMGLQMAQPLWKANFPSKSEAYSFHMSQ